MIRILYDKEPEMHTFYLDKPNMKFYKCWALRERENFNNEVRVFELLKNSKHIPNLYNHYETKSRLVLEMEYIPSYAIWGYTKENMPWDNRPLSKKQIDSIKKQVFEFYNECERVGLVENNNFTFEITPNNFMYNSQNDKLYFYDFALSKRNVNTAISELINAIDSIGIGDKDASTIVKNENIKYFLYPDMIKNGTFDDIYIEGETLKRDMKSTDHRYLYHSLYVNGELIDGQRETMEFRNELLSIPQEEIENKTIIDIGCNVGGFLVYLAERNVKKAIGIESCHTATSIGRRYINHLSRIYPLYNKVIEYNRGDAVTFDYSRADVIFYFSCFRHFGSPEFHKKLGDAAKIIYFEGHAHAGEEIVMRKILPQFGSNFLWTYLGKLPEGTGSPELLRPVFKGVKI